VIRKFNSNFDTLWQKFSLLGDSYIKGGVSKMVLDTFANIYIGFYANPYTTVSVLGSTTIYDAFLLKTDSEASDFNTGNIPEPQIWPPIDTSTTVNPPIDTSTTVNPPIDTTDLPIWSSNRDSLLAYPMPIKFGQKIYLRNANFTSSTTYKLFTLDGKLHDFGNIIDNSIKFTNWASELYILHITDANDFYTLKIVGYNKKE
jgi:hypothetical protein